MSRRAHLLLLPWALWATLETVSVPAVGTPLTKHDVIERFESYQACDTAARWAESQTDLREEWTITKSGRKYHTTMHFSCRRASK